MRSFQRLSRQSSVRQSALTKPFATTQRPQNLEKLDPTIPIEEEPLKTYRAKDYYPVAIGQVFDDRYRVIAKLGYGSASTVWFCRDERQREANRFVALKIYVNNSKYHREVPIYEHINSVQAAHIDSEDDEYSGRVHVRAMFDSFITKEPYGRHVCLAHEPLGMSFDEFRKQQPDHAFHEQLIRTCFRSFLNGLNYLHQHARVIHTDIQPANMFIEIRDNSLLEEYSRLDLENPTPRKELADRTICLSRPMVPSKGAPSLSDLSEARFGDQTNTDLVMPDVCRAPEVILGMEWSYPIDIWGLGMSIWDLFEPRKLFRPNGPDGVHSESRHLAQIFAVLGPPPLDFLQRSDRYLEFWDEDADIATRQLEADEPIPDLNLSSCEKRLEGEEKALFLTFMRKMLQWKPEDRCDCVDVFWDEWLLADWIEAGKVKIDEPPV